MPNLWIFGALALLLGCVRPREVPIGIIPMPFFGATICDQNGNPMILLNPNIRATDQEPFVLLHEQYHVRQMRAHPGGCVGLVAQMQTDSLFRFEIERNAYCQDLMARQRAGYDLEAMLKSLLPYLQRVYAPGLSLEEIRAILPCGGAP